MKAKSDNPSSNSIPPGIQEQDLLAAITASGYPLQGVVAARLLPHFHVVEEWGFIDDESAEHRSLDINAYRMLSKKEDTRCHIGLRLLIECKRSRHPFIFFQEVVKQGEMDFPQIDGVPGRSVWLYASEGGAQRSISAARVLGVDTFAFIREGPPLCATFSKAVPKGKAVELSGTDPFNTIVLPLVKALRHSLSLGGIPGPDQAIFPTAHLCIAVLDAPMLLVESPERADDPVLCPWIRVVRHETRKDAHGQAHSRFYAVDVVHADYLSTFIEQKLLAFATEFAGRVVSSEKVLRFGGTVPSLDDWTWDQVAARVRN
jgi:hypothetical protein